MEIEKSTGFRRKYLWSSCKRKTNKNLLSFNKWNQCEWKISKRWERWWM